MNLDNLPTNLQKLEDDGACDHLLNSTIPNISLPNQNGNLLKLNRADTFRLVIFCYPMTGFPGKNLPNKSDFIPGAKGCTLQHCSFRDNYDNFIIANALPIGVSTQSISTINEMTIRLQIPYDVLSDKDLLLASAINLPIFSLKNQQYLKGVTLIIDNSIIKKIFYPILFIQVIFN